MAERLSGADWVSAGLRALAKDGFNALKADQLAKRLGISRGSFYWHFADIGAFHRAVLERWRQVTAEAIIEELERSPREDRLEVLMRRAFTADASLEIAVRAWALSDPHARSAVEAVDRRRLAYIEGLLAARGIAAAAAPRAQIIYWTYLGFALSRRKIPERRLQALFAELARLAEPASGKRR